MEKDGENWTLVPRASEAIEQTTNWRDSVEERGFNPV
jgi:hypothetical protein